MPNKYYALFVDVKDKTAHIYIYGDITSWEWYDNDVSSYTLSKELAGLDVDRIVCHINSYGGEVAEGLAIYNELKNHNAKITTVCDGFACSAASMIFMAGDIRVMNSASLLMIHNAWSWAVGDANDLRKTADDLDKISDTACNTYRDSGLALSDGELKKMLDAETWITPQEALEWGFATDIHKGETSDNAAASARKAAYNLIVAARMEKGDKEPPALEATLANANLESIKKALIANGLMKADPQEDPERKKGETPPPEAADKKAAFLRGAINMINQ